MSQTQGRTSALESETPRFVSLKAFGDLVILRRALSSTGTAGRVVIGSHLVELFDSLGPFEGDRIVVDSGREVPALFDIKRRGITRALRSALNLRHQFRRLDDEPNSTFVFDQLGWRERFIVGPWSATALPAARNIYIAYGRAQPLASRGAPDLARDPRQAGGSVGIFPASRIAKKNLPKAIVEQLIDACLRVELQPSLHLLEGERPELVDLNVQVEHVPRNFSALATATRSVDMVIAADSLPAHLAEYFRVPVFVLTPIANEYWLPLSAFAAHRWSRFGAKVADSSRLDRFLTDPAERLA